MRGQGVSDVAVRVGWQSFDRGDWQGLQEGKEPQER